MNSFLDKTGLTYFWGKIKDAVSVKADKIQEVNHGTSDTTFTLTPNVMHIWGTVSSLNLSLPTDSNSTLDEYLFTFTCPTGGTTLTLPASIVWIQEPEFEEGKTYQVSIVNGLAGFLTNNMVAGGGSAPGTETDPIFKASPAYGITASDITNWNGKQATLVSGTNIKTVNNESLLGSGNISIQGGGGDTNVIEVVKVNGTALTPDSNKAVDVPVPTALSGLTDDSTHRVVTDTEKSTWNSKAETYIYDIDASNLDEYGEKYVESSTPYTAIHAAYQAGKTIYVRLTNNSGYPLILNMVSTSGYTESGYEFTAMVQNGDATFTAHVDVGASEYYVECHQKFFLEDEIDPTVPSWAKQATKPTYTAQEVGALPSSTTIPSALSQLSDDSTHRVVTDSEKSTWNSKGTYSKPSGGIPASDIASGVIPTVPTNVSSFTNDANYVSSNNTVAIYSGSSAPSSSTGKNGDIYIQTS